MFPLNHLPFKLKALNSAAFHKEDGYNTLTILVAPFCAFSSSTIFFFKYIKDAQFYKCAYTTDLFRAKCLHSCSLFS